MKTACSPLSLVILSTVACAAPRRATAPAAPPARPASAGAVAKPKLELAITEIALPGAPERVSMDYLAVDTTSGQIWVPAGNGRVNLVDHGGDKALKLTEIGGFPTAERRGRQVGPSSAAVGDRAVYIGNRADSTLCAIDKATLQRGACVRLATMPDGLAWVAATHELWVTTPEDRSLTIVEVGDGLKVTAAIQLDGQPEGYAVDTTRGLFYTNLEDRNRTLAIDVKSRQVVSTWEPGCSDGPRGLAWNSAEPSLLFVACTDGAVALDLGHEGKAVSRIATGAGVDNIDYVPARRLLYIASGKTAQLTAVHVEVDGALTPAFVAKTAQGARAVVAERDGTAYVADSASGRLLVVEPPRAHR